MGILALKADRFSCFGKEARRRAEPKAASFRLLADTPTDDGLFILAAGIRSYPNLTAKAGNL